ncbi:MAG TPA: hypothetical protein VK686_15725 [Bryobacteraceae bacterium]|jgi:hypothetical protein|nr:hypothetical protein [Bryobacteraceae bacterium]
MQEDDRDQSVEELWAAEEETSMQISNEEVCFQARSYERKNARLRWALLGATALIIAAYLRNLVKLMVTFREPWLIAGTAWILATFCFVGWFLVRCAPPRMTPGEPCLLFLRGGFAAQRRILVWLRRGHFLMVPPVLAVWWGAGPAHGAKAMGIHSVKVLRVLEGPVPLIVIGLLLTCTWLAFWHETKKVDREIEKLG